MIHHLYAGNTHLKIQCPWKMIYLDYSFRQLCISVPRDINAVCPRLDHSKPCKHQKKLDTGKAG